MTCCRCQKEVSAENIYRSVNNPNIQIAVCDDCAKILDWLSSPKEVAR